MNKTEEEIIGVLKRNNPYPDDIFIEPTKEQWNKFHKILKDAGLSSDGFVGSACRIGYNACIFNFKKEFE